MRSFVNSFRIIISAATVLFCTVNVSFGQVNATELLDKLLKNPEYYIESQVIRDMRLANIDDKKILDHIENTYAKPRRKAAMAKLKTGDPINKYNPDKLPVPFSSCSPNDIGVELGTFASWTGQTSCWYSTVSTPPCSNLPWSTVTLPLAGRITIVPAPSSDPCATAPGFPVPLPSPGGGKFSVKLGNNMTNAESERISHQFIVTPQDTNFLYQYAVVFDDPGHAPSDQPFFDFVITGQLGDTIACSYQHYTAGGAIPGFQTSTNPASCGGLASVQYKPWTTVGVNLGKYVGQQVTITCTTGDCALCGHWGYAYLDFSCGTTSATQFCSGTNSVTVVAPNEPGATYSWSPTGASTQSITVNPQVLDTVSVYVNPPSGCGYFVNFILQPTVINPAMTYSITGCNKVVFTDATTITGGTVSTYSWSFPGGSPASYVGQTPPAITYNPGGTYNVTLLVVSQAGCTQASTPVTVTMPPGPVVSAGSDQTVCGGNTVVLNGSGTPSGGTYSWSPSTGLSSTTIANPTAGPFTNPATYTLTYTNTAGCTTTDVVNIYIGAEPQAVAAYSVTLTCEGMSAQFSEASLNTTAWFWDFGDGSTSNLQYPPPHIFPYNQFYNIQLIVSNGACKDTLDVPVTVSDMTAFINLKPANVFTPNGDGLNDCFKPIITFPTSSNATAADLQKCMTMDIYDRWGIKIYESDGGSDVCWDGKTKSNTKAKDGTYYYIITMGGNTYKGYVTLARHMK